MSFATKAAIWVAISVVALWFATLLMLGSWTEVARGTFGDMFGATNALFSGLAFAGLIFAILLQREELSLQRQELAETRTELAGQRLALEKNNKFIHDQNFESTFFQLLKLLNDIIETMDTRIPYTKDHFVHGRDCFTIFMTKLTKNWENKNSNQTESSIDEIYSSYYRLFQQDLGHYYRILYRIVKFVDQSDIDNKNKYTEIVRAQLSDAETFLLFYNCVSKYGSEKFKPLIIKYGLLKMVRHMDLLHPAHRAYYPEEAYGEGTAKLL